VIIGRFGKISIYVFPDDHNPVHCHVYLKDDRHVRVSLPDYEVEVISGKFRIGELKEVKALVEKNRNIIGQAWRKYHGR
jgi:hypothetical protein